MQKWLPTLSVLFSFDGAVSSIAAAKFPWTWKTTNAPRSTTAQKSRVCSRSSILHRFAAVAPRARNLEAAFSSASGISDTSLFCPEEPFWFVLGIDSLPSLPGLSVGVLLDPSNCSSSCAAFDDAMRRDGLPDVSFSIYLHFVPSGAHPRAHWSANAVRATTFF